MTPDFNKAAIKATETLIKYGINSAPVDPLPILKKTPGVLVMTFEEMSKKTNICRKDLIDMFGCENQDAVTTAYVDEDSVKYVITYNRMLPAMIIDKALARELGHILLGHDGTRSEDVRQEEAKCFAHHLLCPRPLIHAIQTSKTKLTVQLLESITGMFDTCLSCMRKQPPASVPKEMNRQVAKQFMPYILNLFEFQRHMSASDGTALADLGTYMEGYEE